MSICHPGLQNRHSIKVNGSGSTATNWISDKNVNFRILVAEDHLLNQMLMKQLFLKMKVPFDLVSNGREAVEACINGDYDIILMDITMPLLDGYEATAMIRKMLRVRQPYIVALTANATQEEKRKCLEAGMDEFMPKPICFERLQMIVKESSLLKGNAII